MMIVSVLSFSIQLLLLLAGDDDDDDDDGGVLIRIEHIPTDRMIEETNTNTRAPAYAWSNEGDGGRTREGRDRSHLGEIHMDATIGSVGCKTGVGTSV